jgi:5'-nucleotidase (lipoprotein e(P4) family)
VATLPPPPAAGAIHWVRTSAEYRAACVQAYRTAARAVAEAVASRGTGGWAVVLDADETVISNVEYQRERAVLGLGYSEESWNAWVRRREATAIPGAKGFLETVRRLGGVIAIVTNRAQVVCAETRANLEALGLPCDVLLCKPEGASGDKNPRFVQIEGGEAAPGIPPLDVVAYLGDSIRDFPDLDQGLRLRPEADLAAFGARFFVLPNPLYGSWENNPPD